MVVRQLRLKTSTFRDKVCLILLIISALYLIIRLTMVVLTQQFNFVIYSRTFELNLWDVAWATDIFIGYIGTISSFFFFKNKIPSIVIFLVTILLCYFWIVMMLTTKNLIPVEHPSVKENYAFERQLTTTEYRDIRQLRVIVYKEELPLLYKTSRTTTERVSEKHEIETITLFNKASYEVSEDGKTISFGSMKVPLK